MRLLSADSPKVSLDAKDYRILDELIENSRQPLSKVAKRCMLSRQSVEYRIMQMRKKGLITGYRTVINIKKLGYSSYHIFINLSDPSAEKLLKKKSLENRFVNAVITYRGKYSFEVSIMARDPEEFIGLYQKLLTGIGAEDDKILVIIHTVKAEVLPRKVFNGLKKKEDMIRTPKKVIYTPDKLDLRIMKSLADDASVSNIKLAKGFNLSKDTITYRIKKLMEAGYILQFRPAINFYVMDLSIHAILIKLNPKDNRFRDFERYQRVNDSILWSARTMGCFDYILYVLTKGLDEFHGFFNDIRNRFGDIIKSYELLYAYSQYKYSFMADSIIED